LAYCRSNRDREGDGRGTPRTIDDEAVEAEDCVPVVVAVFAVAAEQVDMGVFAAFVLLLLTFDGDGVQLIVLLLLLLFTWILSLLFFGVSVAADAAADADADEADAVSNVAEVSSFAMIEL